MSVTDPRGELAPLTSAEIDDVTKRVCGELFDDPGQAGIIAALMARSMKAAATRDAQDRAGAKVMRIFAEAAS